MLIAPDHFISVSEDGGAGCDTVHSQGAQDSSQEPAEEDRGLQQATEEDSQTILPSLQPNKREFLLCMCSRTIMLVCARGNV